MLARILLSALAALAMVAGASAQSCVLGQIESCTSTEMSSNANSDTATLTLGFTYCAPTQANNQFYGTGAILSLQSGTLSINSNAFVGSFTVTALTGSITTGAPGSITVAGLRPTQAPILSFTDNGVVTGTPIAARLTIATTNNGPQSVSIGSNTPVIRNGVSLPFPSAVLDPSLQNFGSVSQDSCVAIRGDPLFSGFRGQQFYVGGEDGQVMNMISTFNMQLNGRFVTLQEGQAIKPTEQKAIQLASEIAHQAEPSVAAFPTTTAWNHPGNYFGEVGVALLDDNRVYAKAGSYETGFAKVALNGRQLPVADDFIVLGQGVNTTYIQRVSAHELMIRTVNVEFTITNSDNFINIEDVHLEKGFRQHNKFTGLLGNTVDSKWTWNKKDEEAAVVQSNDLFAKEQ